MFRLKDQLPEIIDPAQKQMLERKHLELSERFAQHLPLSSITVSRASIVYRFNNIEDLDIIDTYGYFRHPEGIDETHNFSVAGIYNAARGRHIMRPALIVTTDEQVLYGAVASLSAMKYVDHAQTKWHTR